MNYHSKHKVLQFLTTVMPTLCADNIHDPTHPPRKSEIATGCEMSPGSLPPLYELTKQPPSAGTIGQKKVSHLLFQKPFASFEVPCGNPAKVSQQFLISLMGINTATYAHGNPYFRLKLTEHNTNLLTNTKTFAM